MKKIAMLLLLVVSMSTSAFAAVGKPLLLLHCEDMSKFSQESLGVAANSTLQERVDAVVRSNFCTLNGRYATHWTHDGHATNDYPLNDEWFITALDTCQLPSSINAGTTLELRSRDGSQSCRIGRGTKDLGGLDFYIKAIADHFMRR